MFRGGIVVIRTVRPARKVLDVLRELLLGHRCVTCKRLQGDVNDDSTFRGAIRLGNCPNCYSQYRAERMTLKFADKTRFDAELIREGKLVPREVSVEIRKEKNEFAKAANRFEKP